MFRATGVSRSFTHEAFTRMSQHIKRRDPNERHLRTGYLFLEMMKRFHAYVVAMLFVVSAVSYNQFIKPTTVKIPVQDGRSLVT